MVQTFNILSLYINIPTQVTAAFELLQGFCCTRGQLGKFCSKPVQRTLPRGTGLRMVDPNRRDGKFVSSGQTKKGSFYSPTRSDVPSSLSSSSQYFHALIGCTSYTKSVISPSDRSKPSCPQTTFASGTPQSLSEQTVPHVLPPHTSTCPLLLVSLYVNLTSPSVQPVRW